MEEKSHFFSLALVCNPFKFDRKIRGIAFAFCDT